MKTVKIIKLAGQTGLAKVGTVKPLPDKVADSYIKRGWAVLLEPAKVLPPEPAKKPTQARKKPRKRTTKKK